MTPALTTAPLSTAAAGIGAAGCASGIQTCSGTRPIFSPKPAISSADDAGRATASRAARRRRRGSAGCRRASPAASSTKAEQQAGLAQHREPT